MLITSKSIDAASFNSDASNNLSPIILFPDPSSKLFPPVPLLALETSKYLNKNL